MSECEYCHQKLDFEKIMRLPLFSKDLEMVGYRILCSACDAKVRPQYFEDCELFLSKETNQKLKNLKYN
jgi:hypothetical protein